MLLKNGDEKGIRIRGKMKLNLIMAAAEELAFAIGPELDWLSTKLLSTPIIAGKVTVRSGLSMHHVSQKQRSFFFVAEQKLMTQFILENRKKTTTPYKYPYII